MLFFQWLAGQLDGDGNFHIRFNRNHDCTVSIVTHTLDFRMLQYVKDTLGVGHMQYRADKNCYVFNIYRKLHIIDLLNNINGLSYNSVKFKSYS